MDDPTTLFTYETGIDARTLQGATLLVTLDSFTDAGHAQRILDEHLLEVLEHRTVGRLDLDEVYDYGARRPEITLERDRFLDYERPEMVLHQLVSPAGEPFYLLQGPEPTLQWERVASALRIVVEQLGIRRVILAQGFPAPVPHTRPLQVTAFADDPAHILRSRPLPVSIRMRSTFTALLTLRLGQAGHETVGLVAHVPQYLHEMPYPDAAIALLHGFEAESGLTMPVGPLAPAAQSTRDAVAAQTAQSEQISELVRTLEENYDRALASRDDAALSADAPSDAEIAAEVERFLQTLDEHPEEPPEDSAPPRS